MEKGWIGGGDVGRNTTIVRSNYRLPESQALLELSLKLWEGLSDSSVRRTDPAPGGTARHDAVAWGCDWIGSAPPARDQLANDLYR